MGEFFAWSTLATLTGAATATALLTQFVKGVLDKIPTQIVSYCIALSILAGATAATAAGAAWDVWAIVPLNAVVVSLSANGAFAAVGRVKDGLEG